MLFIQLKQHGDNFSYIIADPSTNEAAIVDPSYNANKLTSIIQAENFTLKYIINTHGHSDHTAGNFELRSTLGGKIVAHSLSRTRSDLTVEDGEALDVGGVKIKVIHTPGHTTDGICLLIDGIKLLTGDTLFIGECGRVDLPGGNAASLYDSLFNKLLKLDDGIEVYPGHDYGPKPYSTIGEERKTNYVLEPRSLEEFLEFMQLP
jgi:hydroxyacylglutathione hydrolase